MLPDSALAVGGMLGIESPESLIPCHCVLLTNILWSEVFLGAPGALMTFFLGVDTPGPSPPTRSVAAGLPRHVTHQPTGPGKLSASPPTPIPCQSNSGRVAAFLCAFAHLAATGRADVVDSVVTGPDLSDRASVDGFLVTTRPPPTCHAPGLL